MTQDIRPTAPVDEALQIVREHLTKNNTVSVLSPGILAIRTDAYNLEQIEALQKVLASWQPIRNERL